jgi:hypothetical protein
MSPKRPHGPQFLYDLGLENPSDSDHLSDAVPARTAPTLLPPIAPCSPVPVPVTALTTPLSYREHATPFAASATIGQPAITSFPNRDAIASLEFSCDPFGPSFDEPILLQGLHPTAGLELVADTARGHPRLRNCLSSTPAARIPYGAAASAMPSFSPSMASQSIPSMTFSKRSASDCNRTAVNTPNCTFPVHA